MDGIYTAVENLQRIREKASTEGGKAAARQMARHGKQVDREMLTLSAHPPFTHTPAPRGTPPAMITGVLMRAQEAWEPFGGGTQWEAHAGPSSAARSKNGPYGRFLEFGGVHEGHMIWFEDGRWHRATHLEKEPRPYLQWALRSMIADGSLHEVAVKAFQDAMGF